jgi:hypothetical protein
VTILEKINELRNQAQGYPFTRRILFEWGTADFLKHLRPSGSLLVMLAQHGALKTREVSLYM